jgi:hypothetical protein
MQLSTAKQLSHRGVTFYVGPRTPFPGIGWAIPTFDHLGRRDGVEESGGAFYDDCEDHPEGAYAWAEAACRSFIDKTLETP